MMGRGQPARILGWLLIVAVAVIAGSIDATPAPAPPVVATAGERAIAHVRALTANGPRVAGGAGDRPAADYIAAQLRAAGLEPRLQPFPFPYFEARDIAIEITAPRSVKINARVLMQSPGTRGPLSAPLIGAGKGSAADFRAANTRGRIALVERGDLRFGEKVANAADAGAVGVLIYNNAPGLTSGTLGGAGRVPAAMISQEDGQQLLSLLRAGAVTASMNLDVVSETRTTNNVIGTLAGRTTRRLVIGAHFDSVPGSPGANDNASGVATMLEAAQQLRGVVPELTVEFVAFGAEELGLLGSEHYVRSERATGIAGMINADMVGVGDRFLLGNGGGDPRLLDFATERARALGLSFSTTRTGASDHAAFERIGTPTVFLHWSPDPAYHTPQDGADRVLPDRLDAAIQLIVQIARSRIPSL